MKILVLGGGISGQLFQHAVPEAEILDWRTAPRASKYLTRHYGANYLWQPIGDLPVRQFRVVTHIDGRPATEEAVRAYKEKVGKGYECDTGVMLNSQFTAETIGYEFTDLPTPRVHYGARVTDVRPTMHEVVVAGHAEPWKYDVLVSCIPLYSLLSLCGMRDPGLKWKPIWVNVQPRPMDSPVSEDTMYVNYLSNPDVTPYRYTDRGGERHFESLIPGPLAHGIPTKRIVPGKIYPYAGVNELHATLAQHGIYCFGRFATWDTEELVHDTWEKINLWRAALRCWSPDAIRYN